MTDIELLAGILALFVVITPVTFAICFVYDVLTNEGRTFGGPWGCIGWTL